MIVTGKTQTAQAKAQYIQRSGRAPYIGYAYEGLKYASRTYGFYQDIKPYLPETYLKKYSYKPRKRVAGYLGQKFHAKKKIFKFTSRKFQQKCSRYYSKCWNNYYH